MDDAPEHELQPRISHATAHISQQQDGQPGVPLQRLIRLTVRGEFLTRQLDTPPALSSLAGCFRFHHALPRIPRDAMTGGKDEGTLDQIRNTGLHATSDLRTQHATLGAPRGGRIRNHQWQRN